MLRLLFGFLLPWAPMCAWSAPSEGSPAPDFRVSGGNVLSVSGWRDRARVIIVFAPTAGPSETETARWSLQRKNFCRAGVAAGFSERDLALIVVSNGKETWAPELKVARPVADTAANVRSAYGVGAGQFLAVLIGKDGEIKRISRNPLTAAGLFAIIDAMPMRRREMKGSLNAASAP